MSPSSQRQQIFAELQHRLRQYEAVRRPPDDDLISTGCKELDAALPAGGLRRGTLVEWLAEHPGDGAGTLACLAARQACRLDGPLLVVDRAGTFYPPAAALLGLPLETMIVARCATAADESWVVHQGLSCPGVAAVLCRTDRCDSRVWRRWQLAAERAAGLGLLLRGLAARSQPCWADVRLAVLPRQTPGRSPAPARPDKVRPVRVEILRSRGGAGGTILELEIDHATGAVHLAPAGAESPLAGRLGS